MLSVISCFLFLFSLCSLLLLVLFFESLLKAAPGTVKTWFPVSLPSLALSLTVSAHLLPLSPSSPLFPLLLPTFLPRLLYLSRGPAVTQPSLRRIRRLSLKNNKRKWKKRQEFLHCDVMLFTWRVLLFSIQSPPPCPSLLQPTKSLCWGSAPKSTSFIHIFKLSGRNIAF